MNKRLDFNKAFRQFRKNLRIQETDDSVLVSTRRNIRSHLRQNFPAQLRVKFLTQGSYAYGTLIRPNRTPPQQMDLDDGAYSTFSENFANFSSQKLFEIADSSLRNLVATKPGWRIDTSKPSCCRLIIRDNMHIDIPLYAASHVAANSLPDRQKYERLYREAKIPMSYADPGNVWLAHRTEGWIESDPREVINWVLNCKTNYGEQFLRACCYLKAWRDNQWDESPLKSILIMTMVAQAFKENSARFAEIGDDEATFVISGLMADYLSAGGVLNPVDDSKRLDDGISPSEREVIISKLKSLSKGMELSLYGNIDQNKAYELIRSQFGKWFPPNTRGLISVIGSISAATAAPSAIASVRSPWAVSWK